MPPPYPDLRFTRHDGSEGPFRQSFVHLYTDRYGFLWGATLDSVFRFDGHRFQQWPIAGGTSAAFSEDAAGFLWVLTEDELWRFDPQRVIKTRIQVPEFQRGWGTALAHSTEGTWLLTWNGSLYRYSPVEEAFQVWWKSPPHGHMIEARATSKGALWWLTDRALWRFAPTEDHTPRVVEQYPEMTRIKGNALVIESANVESFCIPVQFGVRCTQLNGERFIEHQSDQGCSALALDVKSRLYALCNTEVVAQSNSGVARLDERWELPRKSYGPNQLIQFDSSGMMWIGLGNSFGVFNPKTGGFQDVPVGDENEGGHHLPAPVFATNVMLVDRSNVWFGLNGKGLFRASLAPSPFEHLSPPIGGGAATSPLLRAVFEERDTRSRSLWLADAHERVWSIPIDASGRFGQATSVSVVEPSAQSECRVLARSADGQIMYATQERIYKYSKEENTFNPVHVEWPQSTARPRLCGLHLDKDNRLWTFGDFGIALLEHNGGVGYSAEVHESGLNQQWDLHDQLYEGSDGWWWIPYRNGIKRFDPKQRRWEILSRSSAPLEATWIHQVIEQPAGVFWIATRGGELQRIDLRDGQLKYKSSWQKIEPPSESQSPIRYSVVADTKGFLWLAGGRGLDRYDPVNGRWLHFDSDDGLQQVEFNHGAATLLSDGRLAFVGLNGVTVVYPDRVEQSNAPPTISWQGMQVNGGSLQPVKTSLEFDFNEASLTIHYLALDYDAPRSIRYRYRMKNDAPWIEVGEQRQLHFAGLPVGAYELEVQAAYNHGEWAASGKVLQIAVAPPWYLTWQTWMTSLALVAFSAAGYIRIRNRQQSNLEAEIQSKTRSLRETNATLADRNSALDKSHAELNEQNIRLELALGAREKLFRLVSHEFRTPLTKIAIPLDEMIRNSGDVSGAERLVTMRRSVDRLMEMIDALLDKAKTSSELDTSFEKVSVGNVIVTIAQDFIPVFNSRQQSFEISCDLSPDIEAILTRGSLPIMLNNLLGNASKYTLDGGEIRLRSYLRGDLLVLQVSDTGIGMDETTRAQLHSPFYRGKAAQDSGVNGHGLGLHLVFDVVHRNGGQIQIDSEVGRGTTITICLPITGVSRTCAIEVSTVFAPIDNIPDVLETHGTADRKTLLIVEDDDEICDILTGHFSTIYHCLAATNGNEALSIAADRLPDMILCDIDLPGVNGYDVCMALKGSEQTSHIPIIFLTAYASDRAKLQALRVHGDDYITKPPSIEELSMKIANRLRTRDALLHRAKSGLIPGGIVLPEVATKDQELVAKCVKFKCDLDKALEANYARPEYDVSSLGKSLHRSTRTLQRHMEQYDIGAAPLEYIRDFRLKKAAELLRKNRRVALVATECGLDPKTFSGMFRERYGKSPSEWRKSNLTNAPNECGNAGNVYLPAASAD